MTLASGIGFYGGVSHSIESVSDIFLMPSRFEPCGLNQMYSLRYGTIPVVRATGGLDDSVIDAPQNVSAANGIKFYEYSPSALATGIRKALVLYAHPAWFRRYRVNGMKSNFSWSKTAQSYLEVYRELA